jgi:DNA-binding protein H-NS
VRSIAFEPAPFFEFASHQRCEQPEIRHQHAGRARHLRRDRRQHGPGDVGQLGRSLFFFEPRQGGAQQADRGPPGRHGRVPGLAAAVSFVGRRSSGWLMPDWCCRNNGNCVRIEVGEATTSPTADWKGMIGDVCRMIRKDSQLLSAGLPLQPAADRNLRRLGMKKSSLASMTLDALISLRDNAERMIRTRAAAERKAVEKQLSRLTGYVGGGGRKSVKGRKVAAKYRNPANKSETWAGRGARPRWLQAALKEGRKIEEFAIVRGRPKGKAFKVKKAGGRRRRAAKKAAAA